MTKFSSIWGDLDVGKVDQAPAGDERKPEKEAPDDTKAKLAADEKEEEESKAKPDVEKDVDPPSSGDTPPEEEKEKADDEKEVLEFTEDDVSKAYTMLEDEGVLELTEEDEFEQTVAGLGDAVAATVRNKLAAEIAAIPPSVQQFYAHVMEGNDPSTFKAEKNLTWSEVDSSNEEVQKAGLKQMYLGQGMTEEEAAEEVDDVVAAGKLEKKSGIAIATLIKQDEKNSKAREAAKLEEEKLAAERRKEEVLGIEKTIDDADEYAGFKLDDKKKKEFKDYLFKVNPRTGKTQMQENMANEDRRLTVAFLDYVNYSKADLEKDVADKLTRNRAKKLTRYSDKNIGNTNSCKSVTTKVNKNGGKVKFPTIFGAQNIEVED